MRLRLFIIKSLFYRIGKLAQLLHLIRAILNGTPRIHVQTFICRRFWNQMEVDMIDFLMG